MLLNPEILLALLSSRVYSSAESERSTKLFIHQRKTAGQVFILDIIIFFSISAIFLPSFLSLQILPLTRLLAWKTPDSPIPKQAP